MRDSLMPAASMALRMALMSGGSSKLHLHLGAAAEVDAQRHRAADVRPVPAHLDDAGHAENHGKGKEIPLPSQPVHIYAAKKFHCFSSPAFSS